MPADVSVSPAKNLIVLVPDGCGAAHTTLARWYRQWDPEASAEAGKVVYRNGTIPLAIDQMSVGCARTYCSSSIITDSAPAASAFATGWKTVDTYISVLPDKVTMPGVPVLEEKLHFKPIATVLEAASSTWSLR